MLAPAKIKVGVVSPVAITVGTGVTGLYGFGVGVGCMVICGGCVIVLTITIGVGVGNGVEVGSGVAVGAGVLVGAGVAVGAGVGEIESIGVGDNEGIGEGESVGVGLIACEGTGERGHTFAVLVVGLPAPHVLVGVTVQVYGVPGDIGKAICEAF